MSIVRYVFCPYCGAENPPESVYSVVNVVGRYLIHPLVSPATICGFEVWYY